MNARFPIGRSLFCSVYLNQYDHPANSEAHYRTTGPELWEQTQGRITHFVAGAGTGGPRRRAATPTAAPGRFRPTSSG